MLIAGGTDYVMDYARQYRGADPHARLAAQLDAASRQSYVALKNAHVRDFQTIFNRARLNLGPSSVSQCALPTGQRKVEAAKVVDPELEARLFR